MGLKKRAIEGIVVAGSLGMMSTIAQAADLDGVQVRNAAVQTETDFATGGTAGVVARWLLLSQHPSCLGNATSFST